MNDTLLIWDRRYAQFKKNKISSKYDSWMDRWKFLFDKENKEIALDIGCGIGLDTRYLAELGYTVVSIDLSGAALTICRQALPGNTYLQVDIREALPFSKNSFQVITANLSLHYFSWEVTKKIVNEAQCCLIPGGLFLVRLNSANDLHFGAMGHKEIEPNLFLVNGEPKRFFDHKSIKELFGAGWQSHGIEEVTVNRYSKPKVAWEIIVEKE